MRSTDVEQCVRFTAGIPILRHRYGIYISQLAQVWLSLLGRDCFDAAITEEGTGPTARMVAVSVSAFVSADFVEDLKSAPSFWTAAELVRRFTQGRSPFLSDGEVRQANSSGGLNLVVWQNGPLPGEMRRPEVAHAMIGAFLENYRGFRINEVCNQAESLEDLVGLRAMGARFFDMAGRRWTEIPVDNAQKILGEPHVVGMKPESLENRASYAGLIFLYQPPQFGFSRSEQKLLLAALGGASEEQLCAALGISLSGVKKAWRRIYERVADHSPDLLPNHLTDSSGTAAERGKEKRRRLILYLREHPEELRPISRKLLGIGEGPQQIGRSTAGAQ